MAAVTSLYFCTFPISSWIKLANRSLWTLSPPRTRVFTSDVLSPSFFLPSSCFLKGYFVLLSFFLSWNTFVFILNVNDKSLQR